MYWLISKTLNGLSAIQSPIQSLVKAMFNLFYILGSEYRLAQYYEAFDNQWRNAEILGSLFASKALQDPVLAECVDRNDTSTPQRMTSMAGHPKTRLYINSGASLHILFNKEPLEGLQNLDRPLMIWEKVASTNTRGRAASARMRRMWHNQKRGWVRSLHVVM